MSYANRQKPDIPLLFIDGKWLCESHSQVFWAVLTRHRNNHTDSTDGEIRDALESLYAPARFDRGWVSSQVAKMKAKGLLLESRARRNEVCAWGVKATLVRATYIPPGLRPSVVSAAQGGLK